MAGRKPKVCIALSGGVDSSTAAALLLEKGYDCFGVFMITSDQAEKPREDAEEMARRLGIELYILDLRKDFEKVIEYFIGEYEKARTPNPCVYCNRNIKFGKVREFGQSKGAQFFATGHYAGVLKDESNRSFLYAADTPKDQSYALAMIERTALDNILFPLGDYSKDEIRTLSSQYGLALDGRTESQEICFIPDDDYTALLEKRCPRLVRSGNIIDSKGKVLGRHSGTHRFTIGQRRGLKVAMGEPWYVVGLDAESNTVVLGPKDQVLSKHLEAENVNWLIDKPDSPFEANVKIRYNSRPVPAVVTPVDDGVNVEFAENVSAVTPGQLAVFYKKDELGSRVCGGGWIKTAKKVNN